jgi:hypothetical protein
MTALELIKKECIDHMFDLRDVVMRGGCSHEEYIKLTSQYATLQSLAVRADELLTGEER